MGPTQALAGLRKLTSTKGLGRLLDPSFVIAESESELRAALSEYDYEEWHTLRGPAVYKGIWIAFIARLRNDWKPDKPRKKRKKRT